MSEESEESDVGRCDTSRVMRKLNFCLCENKGADQLCSNCSFRKYVKKNPSWGQTRPEVIKKFHAQLS